MQLLKNENNISFITGDQPVINLSGDGVNIPKETILYYPITPKIAIKLFYNNNIYEKQILIGKDEIKYYNNEIKTNSFCQIYSNNKELLNDLIM